MAVNAHYPAEADWRKYITKTHRKKRVSAKLVKLMLKEASEAAM